MIQTIVFAADMSVYTPYLVQHVIALAQACQAKVIAIHAVEPLGSLGTAVLQTYLPRSVTSEIQENGEGVVLSHIKDQLIDLLADEFLDEGAVDSSNGLKDCPVKNELSKTVEVIVEAGKPADVILKYSQEKNADMIVMGNHSPGVVHGYSVGSVTNKVLQLAKVPVFTVPMLSQAPTALDVSQLPKQHPLF